MNTEMTKTEPKNMMATQGVTAMTGLVPTDVVVPRLLLMQPTSDFVHDKKAQPGDIVRSTTVEKIGEPGKVIQFIPLSFPVASWVIEVKPPRGTKFEFQRIEPRNALNSNLPWSFKVDFDGKEVPEGTPNALEARRVQRLSLFALLPSDIEADIIEKKKAKDGEFPDFTKSLMPVEISFRATSFKAGREVLTFFTQAADFGQPAWKAILNLTCTREENDQGVWYIYQVDRARPVPVKKEHLATVERWANLVTTTQVKVDETPEDTVVADTKPAAQSKF